MSAKTIPALAAAIRHHFHSQPQDDTHSAAFWVDSLCIPATQPDRHATLHSMGFIYSRAAAVVVTLSGPLGALLDRMASDRKCVLTEDELRIAEGDEWITSVWTYQEVANSQDLVFVAIDEGEDHESAAAGASSGRGVSVSDFLSCIGYSLTRHTRGTALTPFDVRTAFPRMDALEDLAVDILTSSTRSALQAMSNIDRRICAPARPENRIYAMIGVITQSPYTPTATPHTSGLDPTIPELAESFMRECDRKGDFSYLYSSAERDDVMGRRWRPKAGDIPAVLLWCVYGSGQAGHYDARGFWLDGVHCIDALAGGAATVGEAGRQKVLQWLGSPGSRMGDAEIAEALARRLRQVGFTGSDSPVTTPHGIFFPQTTVRPDARTQDEYVIIIPATLEWVFGRPALARIRTCAVDGAESVVSFVPGVFAGSAPDTVATSVLLDPGAQQAAPDAGNDGY